MLKRPKNKPSNPIDVKKDHLLFEERDIVYITKEEFLNAYRNGSITKEQLLDKSKPYKK